MSDDDFVEGDAHSEAAETPVEESAPKGQTIDSSSVMDAPVLHAPRKTARNAQARKAFAEAVAASKNEPAKPPSEADDLDPEVPEAPKIEAIKDATAAKAAGADPKPIVEEKPAAPPAPSLDPEVRKLREMLQAD